MAIADLVTELLGLSDDGVQKQFLAAHAAELDDAFAQALKDQADQFLRSDSRRSLQVAHLLICTASLTGNPCHHALGLLAEANTRSIGLGEHSRGIQLYDAAAEIYRSASRIVDQAKAQVGKVWSLATLGRYDEALETGRWAAGILQEHGEWLPLAKLTSNLAIIQGRRGEDLAALALFDQARQIHGGQGDAGLPYLQRCEHNRAIVLRNLGRFGESIDADRTAQKLAGDRGHTLEVALARQSLGVTHFVMGRYNEALDLLDQARCIFSDDGRHWDAIRTDLFISDCLLQLRRFPAVIETCRRVRETLTASGERFEVALALLNEAVALTGIGRHQEALASLDDASRLFEQEGNAVWAASASLETAVVLHRQGRHDACLALARTAAQVFEQRRVAMEAARAELVAARAAVALDQHGLARELITRSLAAGESRDVPALIYQARQLLGHLARAEGDPQEALDEYDIALEALERLQGWLMVEFRADFLEDKAAVYEDAADLSIAMRQPQRGLEYAERSKSRALLDLIANRLDLSIRARRQQDADLVRQLGELRATRDRLYRRFQAGGGPRQRGGDPADSGRSPQVGSGPEQVQDEIRTLEGRIMALWHTLLVRNADYARDASLWQVRVEPVQPYLSPETALLEYFAVRGQWVAFVVTGTSVEARRLPGDVAATSRLLQLLWMNLRAVPRTSVSHLAGLTANAQAILHQLHQQLVAPLADLLEAERLFVVPHGPLHYLPFGALYDGRRYLVEWVEAAFLPGASFLRYCCETEMAPAGLAVFGHSLGGVLPHAVHEAQAVAQLLTGRTYLQEEATVARFREVAGECRTLHLATHGDFRPDNPLFSGLALADGWLTTLDIFSLRLRASLVTLSACQTGRSVIGGGDELLGLMRAFLYAGAASLVLSLWAVEDQSTARLMEAFYTALARGQTKPAALRQAQLQFIREVPDIATGFAHPYYWAPFFLVGNTGSL